MSVDAPSGSGMTPLAFGLHKTNPSTLSDGERDALRLTAAGLLRVGIGADSAAPITVTTTVKADLAADNDASVAAAAGLRFLGWSAKETTGTTAALFNIVHGATGAAGTVLEYVNLAPGETRSEWHGPKGMPAASGISIDYISGTPSVAIRTGVTA